MKDLFILCDICNQYKPFHWIKYNTNLCLDCKPMALSNLSRIANKPFVTSCNPKLQIKVKEQVLLTKKRYDNRPEIKIAENIRHRIRRIITLNKSHFTPETEILLGCNLEEFKIYIENLFKPGMTWNNYGNKTNEWSINHILPLSFFNLFNRDDLLKANHYTNLRPLWHIDNMKKGSKLICN